MARGDVRSRQPREFRYGLCVQTLRSSHIGFDSTGASENEKLS